VKNYEENTATSAMLRTFMFIFICLVCSSILYEENISWNNLT